MNNFSDNKFLKRVWVEIDLQKLENNIEILKANLHEKAELMPIIKANAYGHGDKAISKKLEQLGIKYYGVSNIEEAIKIRTYIKSGEIVILGYTSPEFAEELVKYNLIQSIISPEHAEELSKTLKTTTSSIRCHIEIDTGMNRVGLKAKTLQEHVSQVEEIINLGKFKVEGIYTHLSVADGKNDSDIDYTTRQIEYIKILKEELKNCNINIHHIHFLNSAGFTEHNHPQSSLVRVGINMYGLTPDIAFDAPIGIEPILEFKAVVSHVKTIEKGDCVSYGRTFIAEKKMKVATLAVGYADGYSRQLSSRGEVLLHGIRCRVIGRVCMDQMMVDISGIPDDKSVKAGDVAMLIGSEGKETITVKALAEICNTITYEIACGISSRVHRLYK